MQVFLSAEESKNIDRCQNMGTEQKSRKYPFKSLSKRSLRMSKNSLISVSFSKKCRQALKKSKKDPWSLVQGVLYLHFLHIFLLFTLPKIELGKPAGALVFQTLSSINYLQIQNFNWIILILCELVKNDRGRFQTEMVPQRYNYFSKYDFDCLY